MYKSKFHTRLVKNPSDIAWNFYYYGSILPGGGWR